MWTQKCLYAVCSWAVDSVGCGLKNKQKKSYCGKIFALGLWISGFGFFHNNQLLTQRAGFSEQLTSVLLNDLDMSVVLVTAAAQATCEAFHILLSTVNSAFLYILF